MSKTEAEWIVELNCDCPACGKYVNLLDHADFWDGRNHLEIAARVEVEEVVCPECGHEFNVNATY